MWWFRTAWPLWGLLPVCWFAAEYFSALAGKKGEEEDEEDEEEDELAPRLGLSKEDERLRRRLKRYLPLEGFSVLPEIDADALAVARKRCHVPAGERVLALADLTGEESAQYCLVFGCQGIYFRNPPKGECPGVGAIPYAEFPARAFVNHGRQVYLGGEQYLCPVEDCESPDCETLAGMLSSVRQLIASREGDLLGELGSL